MITMFPSSTPAAQKIVLTQTRTENTYKVSAYGTEYKLVVDTADKSAAFFTKSGKKIGTVREQKNGTFSSCTEKGAYETGHIDGFQAVKALCVAHTGNPYLY